MKLCFYLPSQDMLAVTTVNNEQGRAEKEQTICLNQIANCISSIFFKLHSCIHKVGKCPSSYPGFVFLQYWIASSKYQSPPQSHLNPNWMPRFKHLTSCISWNIVKLNSSKILWVSFLAQSGKKPRKKGNKKRGHHKILVHHIGESILIVHHWLSVLSAGILKVHTS